MPNSNQYSTNEQQPVPDHFQMGPTQNLFCAHENNMSYANLQPMPNNPSHPQPSLNHQNSCPSVTSQQFPDPAQQPQQQIQPRLTRSNSDPNLADQMRHLQAKKKREE